MTDRLEKVKEILAPAGLPILTDNLTGIRWTKLMVNSTFSGMSAALGCTYGDVLDNPKALTCVAHIANECLHVMAALGVNPAPIQGVHVGILGFTNQQEMKNAFLIYQFAFDPHRALKASMLQDLEKGIPCEINTINGKVAEMARKAGVATPMNDKVVEIVMACQEGKLKPEMSNLDLFVLPEVPEGAVETPQPAASGAPAGSA
jgi:2-dehydropantoate 2-reductase